MILDIINEDNIKREKHESQTEEVNIYYIKASNGNPPLKIVDTPWIWRYKRNFI